MSKSGLTEEQKLIIKSFADTFNDVRLDQNLGVEALADKSNIARTSLYEFFGDSENVTMKTFVKLLCGLNLSMYVFAVKNCPLDKKTMYRILDEQWEIREDKERQFIKPRERASKRKK